MWIFSRGVSKCSGPYHAVTSSGSVQALNTRSRGASKTRVIRTSWSAAAAGVESVILLSFPPQRKLGLRCGVFPAQVRFESVHSGLPRLLARPHPLHCLVERLGLHPARPPLSLPAADDQPRSLEHLEVARDRRQAHRERFRQLVHCRLALGETGQDRAARGIGESGEGEAELVGRHVTAPLIKGLIKYQPHRACKLGIRVLFRSTRSVTFGSDSGPNSPISHGGTDVTGTTATAGTTRGSVRIERGAKRIRAYLGGEPVADTTRPLLVWERPYYPTYYLPAEDVRADLLEPDRGVAHSPSRGDARTFTVRAGGKEAPRVALRYEESPFEELRDAVRIDWDAMDAWFEEDEQVFTHPRDPYTRVDILPSSRHVRVGRGQGDRRRVH